MAMSDFVCFEDGGVKQENFLCEYNGNDKIVEIPSTFEVIEFACFQDNKTIEEVVIPESVNMIKASAFDGCVNLKKVSVPDNLYGVAPDAFTDPETTAKFLMTNPNYVEENGLIINKATKSLLFALDKTKETYTIPEGLKSIGCHCFVGCENLKEITIPESIEYLEMMSFFACKNLRKVDFPKNLKNIGGAVFAYCDNLKEFTVPQGVAVADFGNEVLWAGT